jgi:hypothetical protein
MPERSNEVVSLNKVLWAVLTGCVGIIMMMSAAWAHDISERDREIENRLNITEQRYAILLADIQDLREHVKEVKSIMVEQRK